MARWNVAGALHSPKGRRTHCHAPVWHVKAVRCLSSSATGICQYPALQSRMENTRASLRESIHSSIRGMGYASLTVIKLSFL